MGELEALRHHQSDRRGIMQDAEVFTIEGTFDTPAAHLLTQRIRSCDPRRPITVDFRHAHALHDSAVAMLATTTSRAVTLVGLSEHHHRLLRYIGRSWPQSNTFIRGPA